MSKSFVEEVLPVFSKYILADGFPFMLDLERSQGMQLYDSCSKQWYLDFFSFFASNAIGFNHHKIVDDSDFIKRLNRASIHKPTNSDIYTDDYLWFIETFGRYAMPSYFRHSFFIEGGALAAENALKVAFDWKAQRNGYDMEGEEVNRMKVLHLERAFHGRSGYTLSLTNTDPLKVGYFPKFDWPRIISPAQIFPETEENNRKVIIEEKRALEQAERFFERFPKDIACIIMEPIQSEGGDRHFRLEFHQALYDMAQRNDALFIYDEIQTGIGMTGKFWAHEYYVRPDILAFGKKTQVCGILVNDKIDNVKSHCFNTSSRLNSTWGGNLVDMVRFGQILNIIEEDQLVTNALNVGSYLLDQLKSLSQVFPQMKNVRGLGLLCAFDLKDSATRDNVLNVCRDYHLLLLGSGSHSIRFRSPLIVSKPDVDEGIQRLSDALKKILH